MIGRIVYYNIEKHETPDEKVLEIVKNPELKQMRHFEVPKPEGTASKPQRIHFSRNGHKGPNLFEVNQIAVSRWRNYDKQGGPYELLMGFDSYQVNSSQGVSSRRELMTISEDARYVDAYKADLDGDGKKDFVLVARNGQDQILQTMIVYSNGQHPWFEGWFR